MKRREFIEKGLQAAAGAGLGLETGKADMPENLRLFPADRSGESEPFYERFAIEGEESIMAEEHLGVANGRMTVQALHRDVLSCGILFAPPYVSSNFRLEGRLFGEKVRTRRYRWYPFAVLRSGACRSIEVSSRLVLPAGSRGAALYITLENRGPAVEVPLQLAITGGLDRVDFLEFAPAIGEKKTQDRFDGNLLVKTNEAGAVCIASDLPSGRWEAFSGHLESCVKLKAGERKTLRIGLGIGPESEARDACLRVLDLPAEVFLERTDTAWQERIRQRFARVPLLETGSPRLRAFYHRALLPLLLNRWEVEEFVLKPYYSTGGINGGCPGTYLWDFGMASECLACFEPEAVREHILRFLEIDLTARFAFSPVKGEGFGPWYPANQEKIIAAIFNYLLFTGDVRFLDRQVQGRSILEWAVAQARHLDDPVQPAVLADYGDGNHHLELRREYRYDHILPDLNGKRYDSFLRVEAMAALAGQPSPGLAPRAEALKRLITEKLWNARDRWFLCLDPEGKVSTRYTLEIFHLLATGVLSREQESGLAAHLNEAEFLSAYGIHSMSKQDPAYDQVDIDHGGGGAYTGNPPEVVKRLYRSGHLREAEDLLERILWWGERMPYWGDSLVANQIEYRRDTPLMNEVAALTGAGGILFGLFGISPTLQGDVAFGPRPLRFARGLALTGVRIRDTAFDIRVEDSGDYEVRAGKTAIRAGAGHRVLFRAGDGLLVESELPPPEL